MIWFYDTRPDMTLCPKERYILVVILSALKLEFSNHNNEEDFRVIVVQRAI